jgi:hypothetical protein
MDDQNNNSTEAPASWNTKYLDPSGFECQLTLRAASGVELLKRAGVALGALVAAGCTPANGHNGKAVITREDIKVCEYHNCEMRSHSKNGETWYSHKLADGTYCKGREK